MFTLENKEAIEQAAQKSGINPRSMLALGLTESAGRVHWIVEGNKVPAIRPEVHVFYRELNNFPDLQQLAVERGLAHPKRNGVKLPRGYAARYDFFNRMKDVHSEAAAASTSFGWGQVMGFNYRMLGYSSPTEVEATAFRGVEGQTELVARYLEATGLTPFMNNLPSQSSAERIAYGYNGPAWRDNNYANKLIRNWKGASVGGVDASGRATLDLQAALAQLGYDPGGIDGVSGPATKAATRAYQRDNGLVADGDAGPMTWENLDEDIAQLKTTKKQKNKERVGSVGIGVGGIAIITEVLGEFEGITDTITSFLSNFSVPNGTVEIALMLTLAYIAYTKYFRK